MVALNATCKRAINGACSAERNMPEMAQIACSVAFGHDGLMQGLLGLTMASVGGLRPVSEVPSHSFRPIFGGHFES